jgi:hypothetical protein
MKTRKNLLPALAVSLLLAAGFAFATGSRTVLKVAYPTPAFHGTPKPLLLPNLEPKPASAPQVLVPAGCQLLSRGRPVTSSDPQPIIGELAYVTDGDKSGIDGTVVELGPGRQWVQIDLGAPARIDAIALWHYHSEPRAYHDVVVQVSPDPAFARDVVTVFNNDHDNSLRLGAGRDRTYVESHFGRLIDARGVTGRYLRLHSQGNTSDEMNHYAEVEVFGAPPATTNR